MHHPPGPRIRSYFHIIYHMDDINQGICVVYTYAKEIASLMCLGKKSICPLRIDIITTQVQIRKKMMNYETRFCQVFVESSVPE